MTRERETLDSCIVQLDQEKEEMRASSAKEIKELSLEVITLQTTMNFYKLARDDREEVRYNAGYVVGIRAYMSSTYDVFPYLEWALLGQDAIDVVERIKKERTVATTKK